VCAAAVGGEKPRVAFGETLVRTRAGDPPIRAISEISRLCSSWPSSKNWTLGVALCEICRQENAAVSDRELLPGHRRIHGSNSTVCLAPFNTRLVDQRSCRGQTSPKKAHGKRNCRDCVPGRSEQAPRSVSPPIYKSQHSRGPVSRLAKRILLERRVLRGCLKTKPGKNGDMRQVGSVVPQSLQCSHSLDKSLRYLPRPFISIVVIPAVPSELTQLQRPSAPSSQQQRQAVRIKVPRNPT
jgi:hypothetical protein